VPLTQRQLDDACEAHLQQRFGEKLDFAVENSLPFLIHDGLIKETADVSTSCFYVNSFWRENAT